MCIRDRFITIADNASLPIDFGITSGVTILEARQFQARGSVLSTVFADRKSPISYGYDEKVAVYFNQTPLINVASIGQGGGGGGGGQTPGAGERPVSYTH